MTDQLPAIISPGALTTPTDIRLVPALIANAGDQVGWRYVEFASEQVVGFVGTRACCLYMTAC